VFAVPGQPFTVGITVMVADIGAAPAFVARKAAIFPVPEAANPIVVLLFVQVNVPPAGVLAKLVTGTVTPLQTVMFDGTVTVGVGLTVMV
jgi:hypothetical protein